MKLHVNCACLFLRVSLIHLCASGWASSFFWTLCLKTFHLGTLCVCLAWSSPLPRNCCCVDCLYCDLDTVYFIVFYRETGDSQDSPPPSSPPPLPTTTTTTTTSTFCSRAPLSLRAPSLQCYQLSIPWRLMAGGPPLGGGGSGGCTRGFATSGRPSQWSSPRPFITAVMGGPCRTLPCRD